MSASPSALPHTIRARIDDSTLERVPRMFSAKIEDVLSETLQNARRAGATMAHIHIEPRYPSTPNSQLVTIHDDGSGIADPSVLLSYGRNGWSRELVDREDAAGMGFLSLARIGCTVTSRPRSLNGRSYSGWRVELDPDHFTGKLPAAVVPCEQAPWPHGTSISFLIVSHVLDIRRAAEAAALYHPLPVTLSGLPDSPADGETLPRRDFLQDAVHREAWHGIDFGVMLNGRKHFHNPTINFHGHTIETGFPEISSVAGPTWSIRANIRDCPELELVLPARNQLVATPFVPRMHEASTHAIYRAMAAHPDPRPTYKTWTAARDAGIHIRPAPPHLHPWRPRNADCCSDQEDPAPAILPVDALIVDFEEEPPLSQAFWRAAQRAGIAERLYRPDSDLAGYEWYDSLPRIAGLRIEAIADDRSWALEDYPTDDTPAGSRPDAMTMHLDILQPDGSTAAIVTNADVAFACDQDCYVEEIAPLVSASSNLQPFELADLIYSAFFCYSDDAEANAWETQRDDFMLEANRIATRLLCSEDQATIEAIKEMVCRHVHWIAPRERPVTITIDRNAISVSIADTEPKEAA